MNRGRGIATLLVLAALACGPTEQPVSGPVTLGPDWTEIRPPAPLRVSKDEQAMRLKLAGIADIERDSALKLEDGRRVVVEGEVVDDQGTVYPLVLGGVSGRVHAFLYRAGELPPGPDYPMDRTVVNLRLRSDTALQIEEIRWICTTVH